MLSFTTLTKVESYAGMLNPTNITLGYPASGAAHPHAVTSMAGTPAATMSYDADGNMTSDGGGGSIGWDARDHVTWRSGAGTPGVAYTYDGDGRMVARWNADGSSTKYIGGVYEANSDGSTVKYYQALGHTIAMRKAGVLYYLSADHLTSTSVVTNSSGAIVSTEKYWPYGATRSLSGTMPTDKQYTGQQVEPGDPLGLYNYKARMYSTVTGRFLSVDPVISGEYDPQAWNGYAYVRNNPLRFTDPTGKRRSDIEDEAKDQHDLVWALRALAAARDAAAQAQQWASQPFTPPPPCVACNAMIAAAAAQTWTSTVAEGAGPSAKSSGGGEGGIFGSIAHAAKSVAHGAANVVTNCVNSATCSGTALIVIGMAVTPLSGGMGSLLIAGGMARMTVADAQGCVGGHNLSCGMLALDALAATSVAAHSAGLSGGLSAPARRMLSTEVYNGTLVPVDWAGRTVLRSAVTAVNAAHRANLEHANCTTGVPVAVNDAIAAGQALGDR